MDSERRRREASRLCGRLGDDDGIDPRTYFDNRSRRRDLRKTRQLCKQVARTLDYVLSGEVDDDLLRNLSVAGVVPAPDAGRLLVMLRPFGDDAAVYVPELLVRLHGLAGGIRAEVARSIHRRKVPELVFAIVADHLETEDRP